MMQSMRYNQFTNVWRYACCECNGGGFVKVPCIKITRLIEALVVQLHRSRSWCLFPIQITQLAHILTKRSLTTSSTSSTSVVMDEAYCEYATADDYPHNKRIINALIWWYCAPFQNIGSA